MRQLPMRTAGVREVRQNLTELLDDVKKGGEVVITDRGRRQKWQTFPDLSRDRRAFRGHNPELSLAVLEDRDDR